MENSITICDKKILFKEYEGQRVVTVWDIARLHNKDVKGIRNNFDRNINFFIENEDYFLVPKESEFARILSTSKEVAFQAINASKNIPVFTESGYLMMTKPMQDELSWQVQRQLVKGYFKLQEIKEHFSNINTSEDSKIEKLKLEQQGLKFVIELFKSSKASTVKMIRKFNESQGLSTSYLPTSVDEEEGRSLTNLLQKFEINISTVKFNKLLIEKGYVTEENRPSTNKKGFKKYKKLTDLGLRYGKNKTSTYGSEQETVPLYFESKFQELINEVLN